MNRVDMRRVEVEWTDSCRVLTDWADEYEARRDIEASVSESCLSVGFLFADNPDYIVVVLSASGNGNVCDGMVIPRHAIKRLIDLAPSEPDEPGPEPAP